MKVKIQFFGMIAELVGRDSLELEAFDGFLLNEVESFLLGEFPKLQNMTYTMSLNRQIVNGKSRLTQHNEIALLPPFAGG